MPPNRMNRTQVHKRGNVTDRSMASNFSGEDLDYDSADLSSDSDRGVDDVQDPHFNVVPAQPSLACCIFGQTEHHVFDDEVPEDAPKTSGLFGEKNFPQVCQETQKASDFGTIPNYGLISVIVKSPDNLTQEQFASQLIHKFQSIFDTHSLKLWLKPFNIIATCPTGGLIETIPDAVSINQLKKQNPHIQSLKQYFRLTFRDVQTRRTSLGIGKK